MVGYVHSGESSRISIQFGKERSYNDEGVGK